MTFAAAIFDMDGLLIDSEPFWQEAEGAVFGALGVPLTREMCFETVGMRIQEAVAYWRARYPWDGASDDEVAADVVRRVTALVRERGAPQPGVRQTIELLAGRGVPLAVATSSPRALAETVLGQLRLRHHFSAVLSAEDQAQGKPHPGVFLAAAAELGAEPACCLAFEDSGAGVLSARAAGMLVVAVPFAAWRDDERIQRADLVLSSLEQFSAELLDGLAGARG